MGIKAYHKAGLTIQTLFIMLILTTGAKAVTFLTEGFEAAFVNGAPPGWTKTYISSYPLDWESFPGDWREETTPHSGYYNAMLYGEDMSTYQTYLITPVINFPAGTTNATLEFWHMQASWYGFQDTLQVYYKTSAGGQWTFLASYLNDTQNWTKRTISLPNINSTYYIGFLGTANYGWGLCIDDVVVSGSKPSDGITTYHAVICGISNYLYQDPLNYCDDDARDIRDALLARANWNSSNITVLIDSAATKSAIQAAIQNMANASDGDDVCLFFFSGHGTTYSEFAPPYDEADGSDEYIVPYDMYYINDGISDDELGDWIAALPTSKYIVILDSCYSGGNIIGAGTVKGIGDFVPQVGDGFAADLTAKLGALDIDDKGHGVVLTACNDNELSVENSGLQNGVFTYYLVQGMAGAADSDANQLISAEECFTYASPLTTVKNPNQHPQIYDAYPGQLDFLNFVQNINISGCIKAAKGVRIKGVNINTSTGQSTTTSALGQYNFTLPSPYSGTITPTQSNWTFSPSSKTYTSITSNVADQNFTGTYTVTYPGNGTPDNPYLIYNAAQLNAIGARADDWFYDFKLMADIDLSGYDGKSGRPAFNRIGYYINFVDYLPFAGTFDGAGHTISNFTFDSNCGIDGVGLFGYLYYLQSQIKNVKLVNVDVNSTSWIGTGALLGFGAFGNVYGCSVKGGKVSSGDSCVGGLIGSAIEGLTINCDANVNVSGDMWVGGLIGESTNNLYDCNASCTVTGHTECGGLIGEFGSRKAIRCSSSGSVTISYSSVADRTAGGLIGSNSGTIEQCYSNSNVSGGSLDEIGGLVGRNMGDILNSYATGSVSGYQETGGLAGLCWDSNVINCFSTGAVSSSSSYKGGLIGYQIAPNHIIGSFWDTQTSGLATSNGGTGKTTAEMKTLSTFTNAGWDFADKFVNGDEEIWSISAGNYPRLSWQNEKYGGGSGTPDDPYLIFTHRHLNNIGNDLTDCNKCFRMMADIDLYSYSDNQFHIIGTDINPFTGVFDGNDYNITNFTYHSTGIDYIGLFRAVSGLNSVIKKVGFINPDVNGGTGDYVGALTGIVKNEAAINNCFVEDGSVKGTLYVGGLVGSDSNKANINDCYNSNTLVKGTTGTGGIEGYHSTATIGGCFSTGGVLGTVASTGGLIGMSTGGTVHHSYSMANVGGISEAGGLIGSASSTTVLNCYSTGRIIGSTYKGGLIGRNPSLSLVNKIFNSFWDIETSGIATSVDGGTGLPTAQMQDVNTFLNAGWDLVDQNDGPSDIWAMPSGGYPVLWWQLNPLPPLPAFSGGDGSTEAPYLISTPQELTNIGYNPRLMPANFMLANDLNMSDVNYYQIGTRWYPFLGSFYGQQHEIHNLHIDCNGIDYVGLIGRAYGAPATIQDIGLVNANVNAGTGNYVGSFIGYTGRDVNLSNCYTKDCIVTGKLIVGGLIGANLGKIEHCYAKGAVEANQMVGLLCGGNSGQICESYASGTCDANYTVGQLLGDNAGKIYRCYANGTTRAKINGSGGLVAFNRGDIFDSYAKGEVSAGLAGAGGLVGSNMSIISRCYSTCAVDGNLYVGGLVGDAFDQNDITASFWDLNTSGEPNSAGGTGKTTVEMKTKSTYTDAGWDFVGEIINGPNDIWTINEGFDYPRFTWETYCTASVAPGDYWELISSVQVGSINNVTGWTLGGYADYTSLATTMTPGTGYLIIVTNDQPWSGDDCGIWIDWNQDNDFDEEDEEIIVSASSDNSQYTGTITPPVTAAVGCTRMRIRIVWGETPIPCGQADWGETEDYTIMVEEGANPPHAISWEIGETHSNGVGLIWCPFNSGYIEPRKYGITKLRVCFDTAMDNSPITDLNQIISFTGVNGGLQAISGSAVWESSTCLAITLSSVLPDKDTYTVTLKNGLKSAADIALDETSICLTLLKGNVNSDRTVNVFDLLAINARRGQSVDCTNAKYDIDISGEINVFDLLVSNSNRDQSAPDCPP